MGKLRPVAQPPLETPLDDAIFHKEDYIVGGLKGHLSNEKIDHAVHGF